MAGGLQLLYYTSLTFHLYNLNLRLIATLRFLRTRELHLIAVRSGQKLSQSRMPPESKKIK